MTEDTKISGLKINDLKIKTIDGPLAFSLSRLEQKEKEYPAFGEYFDEARKLAAGEQCQQSKHGKKVYFWHEDSEYVVAELAKLYCWAAFSSRTIDKNEISIWFAHYGSTVDDFKNAIEMAKGGILVVEETENFFLSLNEFLGLESLDEEKQTAISEGWKVIAEALGLAAERRVILPKHTFVIVILKAKMKKTPAIFIDTEEILEQNNC